MEIDDELVELIDDDKKDVAENGETYRRISGDEGFLNRTQSPWKRDRFNVEDEWIAADNLVDTSGSIILTCVIQPSGPTFGPTSGPSSGLTSGPTSGPPIGPTSGHQKWTKLWTNKRSYL